jgi:phage shock protein A
MITNKAEIGKLLNIAEAEVNDDSVMAAVKNVLKSNSELQNQLKTVKAENASLKNQIGELNNAKVKSLIDKAIAEKKFGEDERDSYTRLANTDFELAEKMIGKMKGVERIVDHLDTEHESEEEKDWTFDDYHKKGKLENLKKTNKEKYNKLYKTRFGRNPQD